MKPQSICLLAASVLLYGCGSGGKLLSGGGGGPAGDTTDRSLDAVTARVYVDTRTGTVKITPSLSTKSVKSRAILNGTAVQLSATTLIDDGGDLGRKSFSVSITNNRNEDIGVTPDGTVTGYKAILGPIFPLSTLKTDFSALSTVSTIAGSSTAGSVDGYGTSATLNQPLGSASDPSGSIYVTTPGDSRIRKISGGYVSTIAGGGSDYTNGIGLTAGFLAPTGIAYNPTDGSLVVSEYSGHRIRRISANGRVSLIAGTGTAGSSNGAGNAASFSYPQGVAIDSNGNIYVADGSRIVRKITKTGSDPFSASSYTVSSLAGSGAYGAANGNGAAASFATLAGITCDPTGNVYATDSELNQIRMITPNGDVSTIAGTFSAGYLDGPGNQAQFWTPKGIVFSKGALFVSDDSTSANRLIRVVYQTNGTNPANSANWIVGTIAGSQNQSGGNVDGNGNSALFGGPAMLCSDNASNLYVPDTVNNEIRKVVLPANLIQYGVPGGAIDYYVKASNPDGFIPNSNSSSQIGISGGTTLNNPFYSYANKIGAKATSDPRMWSFIVPSGVTAFYFTVTIEANLTTEAPMTAASGTSSSTVSVRTLAGSPGGSFGSGFIDGTGSSARFNTVKAVAVDQAGVVYVSDTNNSAIRRIAPNGYVTTIAGIIGTGPGYVDGNGTSAKFNNIRGIAVTPDGKLIFVADYGNNKIRAIQLTGTPTDPTGWTVSTIAGGANGYSEGPGNTALFSGPFGICIDSTLNNIIVSEYDGQRIRRLQFKGGDPTVSTHWQTALVAGSTASASPAPSYAGGLGPLARFNYPQGVAIDKQGWIYVADSANNAIRTITPDTNVSFANTTSGYADSPGTPLFNGPTGVVVDSTGILYVTDGGNKRIRRISLGGTVLTVAGNTSVAYRDGIGASFNILTGLAIDTSGNLIIADDMMVRIAHRVISTGGTGP